MYNRKYVLLDKTDMLGMRANDIVSKIKQARNLDTSSDLRGTLKDLDVAIERIKLAKEKSEKVFIIGDYDVDGETSTYILVKGLKDFGLDVDYVIPERLTDGYGINMRIVKEVFAKGAKLCITCDNGVASDVFEKSKGYGMDFIITDHHKLIKDENNKDVLPKNVIATINPKREDCTYKSKDICGAVVALELIEALMGREYVDNSDFMEMACLATICDVVPLNLYSREIVKVGLERMKQTTNIGLAKLIEHRIEDVEKLSTYSCGFLLGPCLNASGRLETALLSVKLLLSETEEEAELYTNKLTGLNKDRQTLTEEGLEIAKELYEPDRLIQFIKLPIKFEPVVGIIAGRIKDAYNKPTLVCAFNEKKRVYKGSGRSTDYYNMFIEIGKDKKYLESFGGHEKAIGFSVSEGEIDNFKEAIERNIQGMKLDTRKVVSIEMSLPNNMLTVNLANELKSLEPYGRDNSKPYFVTNMSLIHLRRVGATKGTLNLFFRNNGGEVKGVVFRGIEEFENYIRIKYGADILEKLYLDKYEVVLPMRVVYSLDTNEYKGKVYLNMLVESLI